ncbi:hypothetical protein GC194_10545 [bacterium]|nr:hypothetical protein [bacterium]
MKKHFLLVALLFLSLSSFGQLQMVAYSLGMGVNKSLSFSAGDNANIQQGFQPKINAAVYFKTSVKNLEIQLNTSIERLNYSRILRYSDLYPVLSWTGLAQQTATNATLYDVDLGLKYQIFSRKSWSFSTIASFGLIKSWNYYVVEFYNDGKRPSSSPVYFFNFNLGLNGRFNYQISRIYKIGIDLGINKYYNNSFYNMNGTLGIPVPNNFQLIITRNIGLGGC